MGSNNPRILYDGWPLAYQPNSPAALHLQTLLALHPSEVQAQVALPAEPAFRLPPGAVLHLEPASNTERDHLNWEQRSLPRMARRLDADLLHLTTLSPALFSRVPTVVSPAEYESGSLARTPGQRFSFAARLRQAVGQGGLARLQAIFWPYDLPDPGLPGRLVRLPPVVHPAFWQAASEIQSPLGSAKMQPEPLPVVGSNGYHNGNQSVRNGAQAGVSGEGVTAIDLPETYVLYHGPFHGPFYGPYGEAQLRLVLSAWSWAAGAIGEYYPLLLLGMDPGVTNWLAGLLKELNLGDSVRPLPSLPLHELARLYQGCTALFHPAEVPPWGGPVRLALACGKPVVAVETARTDALVGPAAYLVPADSVQENSGRALGAALITVVVEESVAEALSHAARRRAAVWQAADFGDLLLGAYRSLGA